MKKYVAVFALFAVSLGMSGCNPYSDATKAETVISALLNIAKAEEPVLSPADAAILTPWVNLGTTLNGQLQTCIAAGGTMGKSGTFTTCFNAFAAGLLNPTELAQLRLLSASSQGRVQEIVSGVVVAINIIVPLVTPSVSDSTPTHDQLRTFAKQNHVPLYGY